jgi:hypothetical protein
MVESVILQLPSLILAIIVFVDGYRRGARQCRKGIETSVSCLTVTTAGNVATQI